MSKRSAKSGIPTGTEENSLTEDHETTENGPTKSCNDLDDILTIIGSQGKFQKIFLYAILSPLTTIEPILELNLLFMLFEPNHWCKVPGREEAGLDIESWKNLTIPRESDGEFSKCKMYADTSGSSIETVTCTQGWEYDLTDYDHTIPLDFDWVCERGMWATWCLTAMAIGNAIGTVILGQAADKIGRKPVFIITLFLSIFGRLASLYVAHSFWMFFVLTAITGMGYPMIYIASTMIGAELSGKEFRAWIYSFTWVIWVVGMAALPWIAYFTRDWYLVGIFTTVPCILALISVFWIPESPRWLLSMGQVEKTAQVLKSIAKVNGTEDKLTDEVLHSMLNQVVAKQNQMNQKHTVIQLFTKWRLAKNTILVTINWMMDAMIYYVITLNISNLSGNQFANFFYLAMIEVPAGLIGGVMCDKVGRRWTQVVVFVLSLVSSVLAGVAVEFPLSYRWQIFSVISALVTKFAITLGFLVVYIQATEIFPTPLRSTGNGFASTVSSITGIFSPTIVYLSKYNRGAPWYSCALMSLAGVFASAFLPETLNQRLPETLDEAVNFGKGNKFWSFRPPPPNEDIDLTSKVRNPLKSTSECSGVNHVS